MVKKCKKAQWPKITKKTYLVREIEGTMVFVQGPVWPYAKVYIDHIEPLKPGQNFGLRRQGHLANFSRVQWQRSAQPTLLPVTTHPEISVVVW